jgi:hypothetical protein
LKRKQNILGIFAAVLVVGGVISGCSLYKKNSPTAPDYSKQNTATITFTPTWTGVTTSTQTPTPTITQTPTITATPTITNTHVNATDTVTATPTVTSTSTVTTTFTWTPTACSGGYYASSYTFDTSTLCWQYELTPTGVSPTYAWDGTVGSGSVSLNIPFNGTSQQAVFAISFGSSPADLTGKRIIIHYRVDSWKNKAGTTDATLNTYPAGVKAIVKTGSSWVYGASPNPWQNITATSTSSWSAVTLDVSSPDQSYSGYSSAKVVQIGLEINTNSTIDSGGYGTAVFHIDDVTITDISTPTPTATPGGAAGWTFASASDMTGWVVDSSDTSASIYAGSVAAWDGTTGYTANGSVSLYVPFSTNSEKILLADSFSSSPISMTGKTITAKVKVDWAGTCSGADLANSPILAQIVVKSGTGWVYADSTPVSLTSTGTWFTLTMLANSPTSSNPGYDPVSIIQAAVKIQTGSSGTYCPAVLHVDDWLYQ